VQSNERVTTLEELQDIDELYVEEVSHSPLPLPRGETMNFQGFANSMRGLINNALLGIGIVMPCVEYSFNFRNTTILIRPLPSRHLAGAVQGQ
jgi:hypothetical protein